MRSDVFTLTLSGSYSWSVVATEGAQAWTRKLAAIMGLPCADTTRRPRVIFCSQEEIAGSSPRALAYASPASPRNGLPAGKWQSFELGPIRIHYHGDIPDLVCEIRHRASPDTHFATMNFSMLPFFLTACQAGGFPFHGALLEKNGRGLVILASGGTGKSTCCRRVPPPWQALSDDHVLAMPDGRGAYFAHPFPTWSTIRGADSDPSWRVESQVPLSAIFLLRRGQQDSVSAVHRGLAAGMMRYFVPSVFWGPVRKTLTEERRRIYRLLFDSAIHIAQSVPVYELYATLHGRFWEYLDDALENPQRYASALDRSNEFDTEIRRRDGTRQNHSASAEHC